MGAKSRLSSKGQVTVPQAVRKYLGVQAGDELWFVREGARVYIEPVPATVSADELYGVLKRPDQEPLDLDAERQKIRERLANRYRSLGEQR